MKGELSVAARDVAPGDVRNHTNWAFQSLQGQKPETPESSGTLWSLTSVEGEESNSEEEKHKCTGNDATAQLACPWKLPDGASFLP